MSSTSQALQDYLAERDVFIQQDRSLRRENSRLATLSAKEKKADEIIRNIRAIEEVKVWKQDYPDVPHPFPGMEFLTGEWVYRVSCSIGAWKMWRWHVDLGSIG